MLQAQVKRYELQFKRPAGTSRGIYHTRNSWIISLWDDAYPEQIAYGECAPLPDLSCDFDDHYESKIQEVCKSIDNFFYWLDEGLERYPSIRFGLETALLDYNNGAQKQLFDSPFAQSKEGLPINGLIWMGETAYMKEQIENKLAQGFKCIKLKIGAIDIQDELHILEEIRKTYTPEKLELRVDANGAFAPDEVMPILERLAELKIHSIEQPIQQGQWSKMRQLCRKSPIPIALDEELIGLHSIEDKRKLIKNIRPHYLILKPSLHGGISGCEEWIEEAEKKNIGWWVTSALESNIGLNAIAQWTASLDVKMPQGLGTGALFTNNFPSPLEVKGERLWHNSETKWTISPLLHE